MPPNIEALIWQELRAALAKSPDGLLSLDQIKPAVRAALARAREDGND